MNFIIQSLEKWQKYAMMSIKVKYDFRQVSGHYEEHNYLKDVRYTKTSGMKISDNGQTPKLSIFK